MEKKTIAVLFGGQSSEHEVSCISAVTIMNAINTDEYEIVRIGITKEGHWLYVASVDDITSGAWRNSDTTAVISPDATRKEIICIGPEGTKGIPVDVVFPVLHGLYGEDGTVQGLLELAQIPYVGCGVIASAVGMDKLYTKIVVDTLGIAQATYVSLRKSDLKDMNGALDKVEAKLEYPVFVKPSNAGSSKGISKAHNRAELEAAFVEAAKHDEKILVEETIIGRELECAVLGGTDVEASGIGEILAAAEFYDYDAKYNDAASKTIIGPELPEGKEEEIRRAAVAIFKALDGFGLSRVDFFLEKDTNRVVFNEINTLPGFTGISMYPMLWNAKGLDIRTLVAKNIELAYQRRK
ncbi:MAG: D-alanine--D-alanine ligase [Lachnospiraceae bacterium]|nr:D-alanine--D-alanine ligase [Lachnospiraceae bacterium]